MNYVVYEIRNIITDKIYVGSSQNLKNRISIHFSNLKKNKHHCDHLQNSYNKYGRKAFEYKILFKFDNRIEMESKEGELLKDLSNKYNSTDKVSGGDLISNHPRLAEIKKKHSDNYKLLKEKNGGIHPSDAVDRSGQNNGNYRHGNKTKGKKCPDCLKEISVGATRCENCYFLQREISGANNPFFGKTHSQKVKDKIKMTKLKNPQRLPSNTRQVIINSEIFECCTKAARQIGCTPSTILNRCNSDKFPTYKFYDESL